MSNKTQLQTNNTKLDTLITRVNSAKDVAASLPEAGGGGSDELTNVTLNLSWSATSTTYAPEVLYTTIFIRESTGLPSRANTNYIASSANGSTTLQIAKNSVIYIMCQSSTSGSLYAVTSSTISGGIEQMPSMHNGRAECYSVSDTGNLTITLGYSGSGGIID